MINYRKLNLPKIPIKNPEEVVKIHILGGYNLVRPKEILTDEIMDIFSQHRLKPSFVGLFGRSDKSGTTDTRMIHTDIQLSGTDRMDKNSWKKLLFGINWELFDAQNIFSWWDMGNVPECWPAEDIAVKYNYLNGIHYGKRGNLGIPEGATKIEEVDISCPTLVRTNIPHMTVYNSKSTNRVGISIRFDESGFDNWDDVIEFFKPITV